MQTPIQVTVQDGTASTRRSLDVRDILDELPMLARLKDQQWMARLPRKLFVKRNKRPCSTEVGNSSSDTDTTLLSPESLPTPRTARAMSVLVPQKDDEVLEALDARFFTEKFDPVAYTLENLPEGKSELNAFMRTEISAVDVAKDVVLAKLQDNVRANYNALIQGMKVVQEVDLDLVRAHIHVKNGRRLLATAKSDLILSSFEIVKTKRNRDRVSEIVSIGSQIAQFFEEEESMNVALQEYRFITAVDTCRRLREGLSHSAFQGLTILDDFRLRMQDFIPRLRDLFDQSLCKVAGCFDPVKYKELLQAYITLADHSESRGFEFSSHALKEVLSNIPEIIVRSIDDRASEIARRVSGSVSPDRLRTEVVVKRVNENNTSETGHRVDTARVPASQIVEDVTRCYEHLTDLMHGYYLLVQWHRDPFNPLNDDIAYLHRCGIDDDDDDDDESDSDSDGNDGDDHGEEKDHHSPTRCDEAATLKESESPSHRSTKIGPRHSSSESTLYGQVLCDTGVTLLRYRMIVWENIQQKVLEIVAKLDISYGYKMEHIIALSLATTTFTEIGEEFTGAFSSKIRSALRVKCEQYLRAFHEENIELTRMLLETEKWLRITTPLMDGDDQRSLIGLIEKRSGYSFERKVCGDLTADPIYSRRVFPSFLVKGNPFIAVNSIEWLSMKQGIRFHHETKGGTNNGDMSSLRNCDNQALPVATSNESEFVLTSSSLAGFVRLCGAYLKMMECLPQISWDALRLLNNLFELHLYAVFTNFIATDDIVHLFHGSRGGSMMNDATQWNSLRTGICRVADEIDFGEVHLQLSVSKASTGRMDQQLGLPMMRTVTLRKVARTLSGIGDTDESSLYALAARSVACEAVVGQSRLLNAVADLARSYLPDQYRVRMNEMLEQNCTMAQELRSFMYGTITTRLVDAPALLDSVSAVSWNITYISDRHNEYIVQLIQKCGEIWRRLRILAIGSISIDACEDIWAAMIQTVMDTLLQAYSAVVKPTPQGRALMLLDLYTLQNGLDLVNHISSRTVPRGHEYVGNYIKACFYDEKELLEWIQDNKALYSKMQFANLLKNSIGSTMEIKQFRELALKLDTIVA
uniref:Uncharacterized protein n=1 Tax=Peronospora matthiolae TaxID=2874970 RepID=A0AAV1VL94_9STRA